MQKTRAKKMGPLGITRSFYVTILVVLLCLKSSCAADIPQIMKAYPDFSKMMDVLSQPEVAKQMNVQYAITILALSNDVMDTLSAAKRPEEVIDIVKCHVGFDYYDEPKLNNRPLNKPAEMVNLFQSSGKAKGKQGITQLKKTSQGIFFFSSSKNSTTNDAKLVEKIYTRQFNLSVIKIDHPIYILGLNDDMAPAPAPLPPQAASKNAPAPAPKEEKEEVVAESPSDDPLEKEAPAPGTAEEPVSDTEKSESDHADDKDGTSSAGKRVVGLALVFASAFLAAATAC